MNFVPKGGPRSIKSLQQVAESCALRHKLGLTAGSVGRICRMSGAEWRPKTCQYIETEPTKHQIRQLGTEVFKCGAPVKEDSSYCAAHHDRCHVRVSPTSGG